LVVTNSRRSALALTVLGLFVVLALVFDPTAGAKLPPPPPVQVPAIETQPAPAVPLHARIVQQGDTLMNLLQQAGVAAVPAQAAIDALKRDWDPRELKIGQEIGIGLDEGGLKELRFAPDLQRLIVLTRGDDGRFDAFSTARNLGRVPVRIAGAISSSLFDAASAAGMPPAILAEVMRAFSYDVDFQRELQPGDAFEVMYEQLIDRSSGKRVGSGDLIYTAMTLSGHLLQLYRYAPAGGVPAFYTASGAAAKKALLRTPVDGARISSSFGMRQHPILGYTAMHKGVDFAVPTGTPIMASGEAVVAAAGRDGSFGNLVVLRHEGGYSTAYAHMSRIAKGMKPGARVYQGEIIGYVGATGRATGPHLHYEVRLNDRAVNPASIKMPSAQSLDTRDLAAFEKQEALIDQRLASLRGDTVASR
jgi:murein DD-endopeptidase MepM/ murein hydrolase activator NlpD